MGFIKTCLDVLISLSILDPFRSPFEEFPSQKPLLGVTEDNGLASHTGHESTLGAESTILEPVNGSPGFKCVYPKRWVSCNTASDRSCWLRDTKTANEFGAYSQIDISTDYEDVAATPAGITREYWLQVDGNVALTADGFPKTSGKVFNEQFPGPLIEACWGDEIVVHVKNNYEANGTTIHWHGIRQLNTMQMDGVNGVTQCPIAYGDSFTYKFRALQYGHTWYHSHYSLQYADGLAGPLVIHGPTSANYDIDLPPILIQDYVHDSSFVRYGQEESGKATQADSIVVNGVGHDPATGTGSYYNVALAKGQKNLLRLVNGAAGTGFIFSIDNHTLTVVENDLVPIQPYNTTSLNINIGQRYAVIVNADQEPGDYWMRTHPTTGCNTFTTGTFNDTFEPFEVTTGIVRYDASSTAKPATEPWSYSRVCADEPYESLKPVVPWVIDHHPRNEITDSRFVAAHQNDPSSAATGGYAHWMLTPDFLWLDFAKPTILNIDNRTFDRDSNFHIVKDNFHTGYIFMILEASSKTSLELPTNVTALNVSHPLHWHGMDVVLLAQDNQTFDPVTSYNKFNFINPPRRDVFLLPAGGYIAIAFKPDNPGAWLMHCHIAWHASAGLGLQILERQGEILQSLGGPEALDETERVCRNWRQYNGQHPVHQDDSGI